MIDNILKSAMEITNTVVLSADSNINLLFRNAGFRNVEVFRTNLNRALLHITSGTCDLLVLDDIFDNKPTIPIIREVREGKIGDNIFMPIISVISTTDEKEIKKRIEAGADDVVVKPLSVNIVNSRIGGLLSRKMQYVVTPDYIGPARRPEEKTGSLKEQLIDVPNILRAKSEGHQEVIAKVRDEIQRASININERRVSLQGDQIRDLIARLVAEPSEFQPLIKNIRKVAKEFTARLKDSNLFHVSELCQMLNKVIAELSGVDDKQNIELLTLLGQAISLSFKEDEASRVQALEMADLIKSKF